MNILSICLLILIKGTLSQFDESNEVRTFCPDVRGSFAGKVMQFFGAKKREKIAVHFHLSTSKTNRQVNIDSANSSVFETSGFDPSKKTYIVMHGYYSGVDKEWILALKDTLLNYTNGNIITVDWTDGSHSFNYVNAARYTKLAAKRIFGFLQSMRQEVGNMNVTFDGFVQWNRLHLIGHSLGAHIAGQTSHLLKTDMFWKIERITGLDPARPCFQDIDMKLKLDKEDADFVDVIHTNVGSKDHEDGLGLKESLGHIDFYINGAVIQPQCMNFLSKGSVMILNFICKNIETYE
ncbi:hypothetical protein QAD02_008639 [Eretmocerus hayati]|uniref:Uncharacterized protein n=1 Tax=Eretmocerus hayati TaxID=131215 RepID=A0ACC2N738_9HYME|nr:hypothetical protein QAD02_008639 [Eretmocerus hayati]